VLYSFDMFPERQLGLNIFGARSFGPLRLEYNLTLSNGRGPAANVYNETGDFGAGVRLALSQQGRRLKWKAGVSFYSSQFTDTTQSLVLGQTLDMRRDVTVQFREYALEADLQVFAGPLQLHWETMANWRRYEDEHRPPQWYFLSSLAPPSVFGLLGAAGTGAAQEADYLRWGTSLIAAYQLPLRRFVVRPYLVFNFVDSNDNIKSDNEMTVGGGLNWRISGAVVLKAEYLYAMFNNRDDTKPKQLLFNSPNISLVSAQLAIAF
jgi:opacity protein-like surface antigen